MILRIFIDPQWPNTHTDCVWMLCNPDESIEQQDKSEPRNWPGVRTIQSDDLNASAQPIKTEPLTPCDLIFTDGQVSCFNVKLPKGATGRRTEVIKAALEEQLLDDPEECLFQILHQDNDGLSTVAVMDSKRLKETKDYIEKLGFTPLHVTGEGLLLPLGQSGRCARLQNDQIILPTGHAGFMHCDCDATNFNVWLQQAASLDIPDPLDLCCPAGEFTENMDVHSWSHALNVKINVRTELADQFPLQPPSINFAQGSFSPTARKSPIFSYLKPALMLSGVFVFLLSIMVFAEWAWLNFQVNQQKDKIQQVFRQAFPQAALVSPALQMQRKIDARRRLAGHLGNSDFLSLFGHISEASTHYNKARIGDLSYEEGILQVRLSISENQLSLFKARLQKSGLNVREDTENRQSKQRSLVISAGKL